MSESPHGLAAFLRSVAQARGQIIASGPVLDPVEAVAAEFEHSIAVAGPIAEVPFSLTSDKPAGPGGKQGGLF